MSAGEGGTPAMPAGYVEPGQPGVAAGSAAVIRARQVIIVGTGGQLLVYSPTAAAGNLIASTAGSAGTDPYGNHFVQGSASYGIGFAVALNSGVVSFFTGSLAAGWTGSAAVQSDSLGNVLLLPAAGGAVKTAINILDDGSGNATIAGTLSVNGSTSTGAGDNGGVTSGPSGTVNSFPAAGPNHTHAEIHHHPL